MSGAVAVRRLGAVARRVVVSLLPLCLSGCYVLQAASGQLGVMARSKLIERVVADPRTPPPTRQRLELARQAREFALRELALPDGKSYRKYADLGRPYAVWNVVAAPEFSVEPRRWCFPVAGCVAYRGYFKESRARSFALELASRGDDVTIGGVPTYSTLGHLADPVFSTMLRWSESRFVGTIFHEMAHERLYVPGDSEFNEAFASVVEDEGVRRWLTARGREQDLLSYRAAEQREAEFAALLRAARAGLAALYRSPIPADEMRIEKLRQFGRLKFQYWQLRARWGGFSGYDAWIDGSLNNAGLAAVATYHDCVPGLRHELAQAGSMVGFYATAEALARLSVAERHARVCRP